jgi:hypothetical protein
LSQVNCPIGNVSPLSNTPPIPIQGNKASGFDDRPSKTLTNINVSRLARYKHDFIQNDTDKDGFLKGDQVKSIWVKSGLDARSLGLIWSLCDPGNLGKLDIRGFAAGKKLYCLHLGMFLIDENLRGVPLPSSIPSELLEKCG